MMDEDLSGELYIEPEDKTQKKGYFKLVGPNWELVIPQTTILIGRNPEGQDPIVDVHLGQNKLISRKHAKIRFNFTTDYFMLKCLSSNGLRLNDKFYRRHHGYQKLESKDRIQIGNTKIDFYLPFKSARKNEKRKQQREANIAKRKKNPAEGESLDKPPLKKQKTAGSTEDTQPTGQPAPQKKKTPKVHPNPLQVINPATKTNPSTAKETLIPPGEAQKLSGPASLQERILQEMKSRLTQDP